MATRRELAIASRCFYDRQYYMALYAQDSWKISPRLTLNYGLRWEPYTAPWNKFGSYSHFDDSLYLQGVQSSLFKNAPPGLVFPGDPQYGCGQSLNCDQWAKFFPRVGLVWDPFGDGKTSIRASYGMFGDRNHMFYSTFMHQYAPFGNNISINNANITDPWGNYPGGDPLPALQATGGIGAASPNAPFYPQSTFTIEQLQSYQAPYTNQWNVSIQRQVGTNWLFTVNYLGSSQIHLDTSNLLNPAVYMGLDSCTLPNNVSGQLVTTTYPVCSTVRNYEARRVLTLQNPAQGGRFAGVSYQDVGGTGTYDGLAVTVQKRLSQGLTFTGTYTWSHCISDVQDQQTSVSGVAAIPGNRRAYRGNCIGIDVRHNFILNLVATTPHFTNNWARILGSNWQIAPIFNYLSAQHFSVLAGTDRALTNATSQVGNLVLPNSIYPADQGVNHWLNPAAFAIPASGTYGNLPQNDIAGPHIIQLNMALSRTFPIRERISVQIRAEAFNAPNLLNGAAPTGAAQNLNNPLFGKITTDISGTHGLSPSGDPRIIQLVGKFVF